MPDVNDYKWELYNLTEDYSQANDLAAKMPDKLKEMQELFLAGGSQVQRASAGQLTVRSARSRRGRVLRPDKTVFTYSGEMSGIPLATHRAS